MSALVSQPLSPLSLSEFFPFFFSLAFMSRGLFPSREACSGRVRRGVTMGLCYAGYDGRGANRMPQLRSRKVLSTTDVFDVPVLPIGKIHCVRGKARKPPYLCTNGYAGRFGGTSQLARSMKMKRVCSICADTHVFVRYVTAKVLRGVGQLNEGAVRCIRTTNRF